MKNILVFIFSLMFFSCGQGNQQRNSSTELLTGNTLTKDTILIGKMHCEMCVASIEKGVKSVEGVEYVKAILDDSIAVVHYDNMQTSLNEIHQVIKKRGYLVKSASSNP